MRAYQAFLRLQQEAKQQVEGGFEPFGLVMDMVKLPQKLIEQGANFLSDVYEKITGDNNKEQDGEEEDGEDGEEEEGEEEKESGK